MVIARLFAVILMVLPPAMGMAGVPGECVDEKAAQIVVRGINVADVPVVARMIAEDMCLHTMQPYIDELKALLDDQDMPRRLAIEVMTEAARKALLKEMGLAD